MAWQNPSQNPPNVDSGFVTLTGVLTNVPGMGAGTFWPVGLYLQNPTGAAITPVVQDANGTSLVPPNAVIAAGGVFAPEIPFMPVVGPIKWSGAGLVGKVWGYQ